MAALLALSAPPRATLATWPARAARRLLCATRPPGAGTSRFCYGPWNGRRRSASTLRSARQRVDTCTSCESSRRVPPPISSLAVPFAELTGFSPSAESRDLRVPRRRESARGHRWALLRLPRFLRHQQSMPGAHRFPALYLGRSARRARLCPRVAERAQRIRAKVGDYGRQPLVGEPDLWDRHARLRVLGAALQGRPIAVASSSSAVGAPSNTASSVCSSGCGRPSRAVGSGSPSPAA